MKAAVIANNGGSAPAEEADAETFAEGDGDADMEDGEEEAATHDEEGG